MYRLYKEKCELDNVKAESERAYSDIFNGKFNLGFGNPKSDVCSKCDSGQGGEDHIEAANLAQQTMQEDRDRAKGGGGPIYITFDLQKTMPLPKIPTSVAFYLRQLWFYNLGVHLVTGNGENGYMQTWTENEAGRGATEICSALLAFLESARDQIGEPNHLIAWSDSCGGQNKNFTVVTFWQYLLAIQQFKVIEHKFPEVGHSYMDSDRDFGLIEKALRKVERIFSAEEYRDLIKAVKIHKTPFVVQNIAGGLVNANNLKIALKLTKRQRNTNRQVIEFRKIRWIRLEKFGFYKYRLSFDESEEWKEVDIRGRHFNPDVNMDLSSPDLLIAPGRLVNSAKLADLKKQLPFIPRIHQGLYNGLVTADECSAQNSATGSDFEDGSDVEY